MKVEVLEVEYETIPDVLVTRHRNLYLIVLHWMRTDRMLAHLRLTEIFMRWRVITLIRS